MAVMVLAMLASSLTSTQPAGAVDQGPYASQNRYNSLGCDPTYCYQRVITIERAFNLPHSLHVRAWANNSWHYR